MFNLIQLMKFLSILNNYGDDAQIIAGGQSIVSMLNMRLIKPKILIDINFLKDSSYIISKNESVFIGPTYRQLDLEKEKILKTIYHYFHKQFHMLVTCNIEQEYCYWFNMSW